MNDYYHDPLGTSRLVEVFSPEVIPSRKPCASSDTTVRLADVFSWVKGMLFGWGTASSEKDSFSPSPK